MPVDPTLEFDEWGTTTGLLETFNGYFSNSFFGTKADYNDGQTLLFQSTMITDDPDVPEYSAQWGCGDKWETADKGKTAKREDGKKTQFNENSGYGTLIDSLKNCEGAIEVLRSRPGGAFKAENLNGLGFHFITQHDEFDIKGEKRSRNVLVADSFLGVKGDTATSSSGESTPAASTNGTISKPLEIKLKKLAKESSDFSEWVEKAFEIDGVNGNSDVEKIFDDESWFESARA